MNQAPREGRGEENKKRIEKRTEDDLIPLLPHFCDNRLSRVNDTSKPDLDVFELAERLQDLLACNTHGAQTMKDGPRGKRRGRTTKSVPYASPQQMCKKRFIDSAYLSNPPMAANSGKI